MNQNYVKYMICQLQVTYYSINKNYCSSQTVHLENLRLNTIIVTTTSSAFLKMF